MKKSKKVVASIEARMGSSRLPGKVLKKIGEEEVLSLLVKRLKNCKQIDEILVATTDKKKDNPIVDWCKYNNIHYFRGSENDVLDRVVKANKFMNTDIIVEITADCPFTDPFIVDLAVETYLSNNYDVVTNCGNILTWPLGQYAQVFSLELLSKVNECIDDQAVHEHVSLYFYENSEKYNICELEAPLKWRYPQMRLVLDYEEDLIFHRKVFEMLYEEHNIHFNIDDIIKLLLNNPQILKINSHCVENTAR